MAMSNRRWAGIALLSTIIGLLDATTGAAGEMSQPVTPTSATALALARWAQGADDNGGRPFLVIDKVAAEVLVFSAGGELVGAAAALLGSAHGDDSAPGIGDRPLADIRPEERTTPAGRFLAGFGPAAGRGEEFWVDYATALSLHPVVTHNPKERRLRRLRSPSAHDNRITFGCINVDRAFFDATIRATFKGTPGVVYILPESRPLDEVFPRFAVQARAGTPTDGVAAAVGSRAERPGPVVEPPRSPSS